MAHRRPTGAIQSAELEPSPAAQRANIARIHSEIARCKLELAELTEELAAAEERLDDIVYPVLTLPNEITSTIFVACLPIFVACLPSHGRVRPSPQTAPLLLAQVCGHWREVALATTELWSSFDLASAYPGSFRLLESWISRAKRSPLSLT
ncbi:hypothetical protein C8R46DRAFT_879945, partial [Mycena filopes]